MKAAGFILLALVFIGCNRKKVSLAAPVPQSLIVIPAEPVASPVKRVRRSAPPPPSNAMIQVSTPPLEFVKTPEEKQAMLEQIKASVARAESNLSILRSRQLNGSDARELGRVNSFLRQARTAEQSSDLVTARQYAQRAELLSVDLLNR
jgi:hypothetical protein